MTKKVKAPLTEAARKYLAEIGARGGAAASGRKKRNRTPGYYQKIGQLGAERQWGKKSGKASPFWLAWKNLGAEAGFIRGFGQWNSAWVFRKRHSDEYGTAGIWDRKEGTWR